MKEYCFGRSYRPNRNEDLLKCVIAYEVGADRHRLHAHIVATHDGSSNRDAESVSRLLARKWSRLLKLGAEGDSFVHVVPIDVLRDRVWYMTKQMRAIERWQNAASIDFA